MQQDSCQSVDTALKMLVTHTNIVCVCVYLYFRARLHLLFLWDGVGHHHGLERGAVDARDGRTGENAVCEDGVDLYRAGINQPKREK